MFTEANSLNKEAFMLIRIIVWDKWATKPTLIKAAKQVGVTNEVLTLNSCNRTSLIEEIIAWRLLASHQFHTMLTAPNSSFVISPDKRRGSAFYWKYNADPLRINELHEKSIQLEEILGFVTIRKVKPYLSNISTQITQVHGSMKAKDVLSLVAGINEKKEQKVRTILQNAEKKRSKENLY